MEEAPIIVFIFEHRDKRNIFYRHNSFWQKSTYQSIGAAIENMSLSAASLGLGSLWICDVLFFQRLLRRELKTKDEIMAALILGIPDENPSARPRKKYNEIVNVLTK